MLVTVFKVYMNEQQKMRLIYVLNKLQSKFFPIP